MNPNPKNHKKDAKKKNILAIDSSKQVEGSSYVDENIVYTLVQKKVNLSSQHKRVRSLNTPILISRYRR